LKTEQTISFYVFYGASFSTIFCACAFLFFFFFFLRLYPFAHFRFNVLLGFLLKAYRRTSLLLANKCKL
jgi:hypothetical protein